MLFESDIINDLKKPQIFWHMVNYLLSLICMSLKFQTEFTLAFLCVYLLYCEVGILKFLLMSKGMQQSVFEKQHENSHKNTSSMRTMISL